MAKQFGIISRYDNQLEFIVKVIDLWLTVRPPKEKLYQKAKEALAYYIIYDYNKDTVKDVETSISENIKKGYVRSINTLLRKNGFLIKDKTNKQKSYLSPEMQKIRQEFIKDGGKTFTIGFLKTE